MRSQHIYIFFIKNMWYCISSCRIIKQTSLFCCFLNPISVITISVKNDTFVIFYCFSYRFMKCKFKILYFFKTIGINFKAFSNCCVQHNIGTSNTVGRTEHTELEFVTSKSKRRCSVAVGCITIKFRKNIDSKLHLFLFSTLIWCVVFNRLQNCI